MVLSFMESFITLQEIKFDGWLSGWLPGRPVLGDVLCWINFLSNSQLYFSTMLMPVGPWIKFHFVHWLVYLDSPEFKSLALLVNNQLDASCWLHFSSVTFLFKKIKIIINLDPNISHPIKIDIQLLSQLFSINKTNSFKLTNIRGYLRKILHVLF